MSLKRINQAIAKIDPHCELVKGDGYHYLVWDDGTEIATESVMVMYTSHLPQLEWLYEARQFIEKKKG
jgi:hypothetical protein